MHDVFQPGVDEGLYYVRKPENIVYAADGASLKSVAASEHEVVNRKLHAEGFDTLRTHKIAVVSSAPVVMKNVKYVQDYYYINGKGVLSGHAGDRFLASIPLNIRSSEIYNGNLLGASSEIPVWNGVIPKIYTINCRNFFNFYHFMTETMPSLMCLKDLEPSQIPDEIRIISRDHKVVRSFIVGFVRTLLGSLADKIIYSSAEKESEEGREFFESTLSSYNHRYYIPQTKISTCDVFKKELVLDNYLWGTLNRSIRKGFLKQFTIDAGLKSINKIRFAWDGPKKVFIIRKTGRDRYNESIGKVQDKLLKEGFAALAMEDLTPQQQIAMWGNVDIIVGEHGAAFAGMMFARRETTAIELGNLQTRIKRWGDFFCSAHASGCNYINIFADVDCEDPANPPPMSRGHRGPLLGKRAVEAVMDHATGAG